MKKYDTEAKRTAFIKKKGNIVTFKKAQWGKKQVIISSLSTHKESVMINGEFGYSSPWFATMQALHDAIDWDWMEGAHS